MTMSFIKLPAISYVLRKTLGVRSYAASRLLPWGGRGGGTGPRWSWGARRGEEKEEEEELGNHEVCFFKTNNSTRRKKYR